jgi:hypothetical protein
MHLQNISMFVVYLPCKNQKHWIFTHGSQKVSEDNPLSFYSGNETDNIARSIITLHRLTTPISFLRSLHGRSWVSARQMLGMHSCCLLSAGEDRKIIEG